MSTTAPQADGNELAQDADVPHARYTKTSRAVYNSQQQVADAWADGKYPTHTNGRLRSSGNFEAIHNDDGSGKLMHYRTREAIRTTNGLVLSNEQCWAAGSAHCSPPRYTDGSVPVSLLEEQFMHLDHSIYDITAIDESTDEDGNFRIVEVANGAYGIVLGRDPSIIDRENRFAFKLDPAELAETEPDDVPAMLMPDGVRYSGLETVDSSEFTKTRLEPDEASAHEAAGGETRPHEYQEDTRMNFQHYRADLQGEVIVRQGEWFFVPVSDDDLPFSVVSSVPDACDACDAAAFDVDETEPVCKACGHRHIENPEFSYKASKRLGSHRPNETVLHGNETYVRGEVRHATNDHNATNLGDTWHRAYTHDRDVTVYGPGRGGGRGD